MVGSGSGNGQRGQRRTEPGAGEEGWVYYLDGLQKMLPPDQRRQKRGANGQPDCVVESGVLSYMRLWTRENRDPDAVLWWRRRDALMGEPNGAAIVGVYLTLAARCGWSQVKAALRLWVVNERGEPLTARTMARDLGIVDGVVQARRGRQVVWQVVDGQTYLEHVIERLEHVGLLIRCRKPDFAAALAADITIDPDGQQILDSYGAAAVDGDEGPTGIVGAVDGSRATWYQDQRNAPRPLGSSPRRLTKAEHAARANEYARKLGFKRDNSSATIQAPRPPEKIVTDNPLPDYRCEAEGSKGKADQQTSTDNIYHTDQPEHSDCPEGQSSSELQSASGNGKGAEKEFRQRHAEGHGTAAPQVGPPPAGSADQQTVADEQRATEHQTETDAQGVQSSEGNTAQVCSAPVGQAGTLELEADADAVVPSEADPGGGGDGDMPQDERRLVDEGDEPIGYADGIDVLTRDVLAALYPTRADVQRWAARSQRSVEHFVAGERGVLLAAWAAVYELGLDGRKLLELGRLAVLRAEQFRRKRGARSLGAVWRGWLNRHMAKDVGGERWRRATQAARPRDAP